MIIINAIRPSKPNKAKPNKTININIFRKLKVDMIHRLILYTLKLESTITPRLAADNSWLK